jgi:hypothetical protein
MHSRPHYARPTFDQALNAWKALLQERGLPAEFLWVYNENLCFEPNPVTAGGFRLGFQTLFTPAPPDAERIAFDYFCAIDAPLVFYRAGTAGGKSVCLMLCDPWFDRKTESDGFVWRRDWLLALRPGANVNLEEIRDEQRWKNRIVKHRPLDDLDFSMTLRSIHENLAHGRVLTAYERYALRFLHLWSRVLHPHGAQGKTQ